MTRNHTDKPPSNIDTAEIARFEAMAPIWWDRQGDYKALHDINGLRLDFINQRAPLAGKAVLDVGCGGGILSEAMAALGAVVTGIDMGEVALGVAQLHLRHSGLEVNYQQATAEQFAETHPAQFDVVTCLELLEHVPNPASVVKACKDLVKPGGDVFFATLNRNLKSFLFAIVGAEYILGLVRKGTHTYRKFIKPEELKDWAKATGLVPMDLCGLHYNPLLKRYTLGGNTHVNYLAHFRRI
ncbi:MAG: bifunctional 2-polyprenyl-6-hydroxyphenol methylase/3-demethylubiquinol 3-O-methyltransferase UbiG [Deltaproteobacteria bacterium]|jgi:2-polyprenyl-6-hydroxyphenyl methylase/3-demethylubiquinone-9 3-methyltransferase|nr:bifunctional 2-polyprenyl-6-hydroxyphenol methylase/3-demethylubiquinol 3-O-methyltransferase UbiG [Deltaproteobacteria bacterium]